jgi:hypothetical protein
MIIEIVDTENRKPVRPARNKTDIVARARLKRWLDTQVSPFARRAAERARQPTPRARSVPERGRGLPARVG